MSLSAADSDDRKCPCAKSLDQGLHLPAAFAYTVNASMGIGFLTVPYTVMQVGLWPGVVTTAVLGVFGMMTGLWCIVGLSLTSALRHCGAVGDPEERVADPLLMASVSDVFDIRGPPLTYAKMFGLLFGDWVRRVISAVLWIVLVGVMWAYAALVASSLAVMLPAPFIGGTCDVFTEWSEPGCAARYYVFLGIFAVIAVSLSVVQLRHQQPYQVFMTFCRFLLIVLILGDCIRHLALDQAPPQPKRGASGHAAPLGAEGLAYDPDRRPEYLEHTQFNIWGMPRLLSVVTLALACHTVIPEVVQEMAKPVKAEIPVAWALIVCATVYCVVGVLVPLTFGHWTRPVCSMNWANYTMGQPTAGAWAILMRSFILLVPVVDVTSAYPIFAQSLAANAMCTADELDEEPEATPMQCPLRLLFSLLPVIGAACIFDISAVLGWTGLLTLPFVFMFPQILLLRAQAMCEARFGEKRVLNSPFWRWYCDRRLVIAGLIFGSVLFACASPAALSHH